MKDRSSARDRISADEARTVLGLYADVSASVDELTADVDVIVAENLSLATRTDKLREQGLQPSPVWELTPDDAGRPRLVARLAVLPASFRGRYFEEPGRAVLDDAASRELVAEVFDEVAADPVGALVALESTLRAWLDDTAPTRQLTLASKPQHRLLTLLLADIARKGAAGLDDLEWMLSIGLDPEELRDDDSPPIAELRGSSDRKLRAMWAEERAWLAAAFGRAPRR